MSVFLLQCHILCYKNNVEITNVAFCTALKRMNETGYFNQSEVLYLKPIYKTKTSNS